MNSPSDSSRSIHEVPGTAHRPRRNDGRGPANTSFRTVREHEYGFYAISGLDVDQCDRRLSHMVQDVVLRAMAPSRRSVSISGFDSAAARGTIGGGGRRS